MSTQCPICRKRYKYATSYGVHLQEKHPLVAQSYLATNTQQGSMFSDEGSMEYPEDYTYDSDLDDLDNASGSGSDQESESGFNMNDIGSQHESTTNNFEDAGISVGIARSIKTEEEALLREPWAPFQSAEEFRLAYWFVRANVSQAAIDDYFRSSLGPADCSFRSGHSFTKKLEMMQATLGRSSWHHSEVELGGNNISYYYRDPIVCIRYLLRQRAYRDDMVYAPVVEYNRSGERMYGEMQTGNWWWEKQV